MPHSWMMCATWLMICLYISFGYQPNNHAQLSAERSMHTVDAGLTGYPAKEKEDLVQLGFFPCNLSSRTIK